MSMITNKNDHHMRTINVLITLGDQCSFVYVKQYKSTVTIHWDHPQTSIPRRPNHNPSYLPLVRFPFHRRLNETTVLEISKLQHSVMAPRILYLILWMTVLRLQHKFIQDGHTDNEHSCLDDSLISHQEDSKG